MSEHDYEDDNTFSESAGAEGFVKITADVAINIEDLNYKAANYVRDNIIGLLNKKIEFEVNKVLDDHYSSKESFGAIVERIIKAKLDERYPDVVENKVNELAEKIKKFEFKTDRNEGLLTLQRKAESVVNKYIETELALEVKKSKEYLEQFSKNYFANNLFRAMGMMDKLIPVANPDATK